MASGSANPLIWWAATAAIVFLTFRLIRTLVRRQTPSRVDAFILVGFAMLAVPIVAMLRARRTVYAVTDKRLLTLVAGRAAKISSALIDRVGPIERKSKADGRGSIKVQTHSKIDSDGDCVTQEIQWIGIADAARVERLILAENRRG